MIYMTSWTQFYACTAVLVAVAGAVGAQDVAGTEVSATVPAEMVAPTEQDAARQYEQARESFKAMAAGTPLPEGVMEGEYQVSVFSDATKQFHPGSDDVKNVALGHIHVTVDVEDVTLRDVVNEIVGQAAQHSGAWTVKWRLKPENAAIPDEKVNLTAESNFDDFVARLTERVRNMTGVGLYVTAYEGARVILITDSFN